MRSHLAQSALARVYRLFSKVRPEEAVTATMMTAIVFVLMTGYYLLKTAREPLILLEGGAEAKLYVEAIQAVLMIGVVRTYGVLASHSSRLKLLAAVYLFFASNMVIFGALAQAGLKIGIAFFFWVGIFSYTSIAQFWAFAADIYSEEQGKRLFPIVGIGSSVGAVAGAAIAQQLVHWGPAALMFGAAALVVACVAMLAWVDRRVLVSSGAPSRIAREPVAVSSPLRLLASDPYLILIGALTLLLNCVSGLGEYILDRTLLAHVRTAHLLGGSATSFIGSFKATYFAWYNGLGVFLQLFVVSRVLTRYGVRNALLVLPVTACFGYGAFCLLPSLALIRAVVIADRGLDYSLTNTSRHALFLVASRTEKYVGKTLVDTVGARSGDVLSALVVWLGMKVNAPVVTFSGICVLLTGIWVAIVLGIGREHVRRSTAAEALPPVGVAAS